MKKNKGFTLIELLVVIAIIGILAGVVLQNLALAKTKSADTAIKANLKSAPAQAEIYASLNNFHFTGVCGNGAKSIKNIADTAAIASKLASAGENNVPVASTSVATCNENGVTWAIEIPLLNKNGGTTNMFCVDSKGFVGTRITSMTNTALCPAS